MVTLHLDRTHFLKPTIITTTLSSIALNEVVDQLPLIILLGQLHSFILPAKHPKALESASKYTVNPKEREVD